MSQTKRKQQPKKEGYEFFGPTGAFLIAFVLPLLLYSFQLLIEDVNWRGTETIFNTKALLASVGWLAWSLLLYTVLPAHELAGTLLESGGRLKYRFNAFPSALITLAVLAAGTVAWGADWVVWCFITENYIPLYTANLVLAYVIATLVYIHSFSAKFGDGSNRELAAGGHTGNTLYDWFIGRELNPRIKVYFILEVDIKIWMEMRPSLLGLSDMKLHLVLYHPIRCSVYLGLANNKRGNKG